MSRTGPATSGLRDKPIIDPGLPLDPSPFGWLTPSLDFASPPPCLVSWGGFPFRNASARGPAGRRGRRDGVAADRGGAPSSLARGGEPAGPAGGRVAARQ